MKITIFVIGLLIGINLGFVIMIPSRNIAREDFKRCVDSYSKSTQTWKEIVASYSDSANKAAAGFAQCIQDYRKNISALNECIDELGLLQGRSK